MTVDLTITQTPTGWHIEATGPASPHPFSADLLLCSCDGRKVKMTAPCPTGYHVAHVAKFLKMLARTYVPVVAIPEVPFDAEKVAA